MTTPQQTRQQTPRPGPLAAAEQAVTQARTHRERVRRLVARRQAGASALHVADYTLHCALTRLGHARETAAGAGAAADDDVMDHGGEV